jgi:hypothetical protein
MDLWNLFAWACIIITGSAALLGLCVFAVVVRRAFAISVAPERARLLALKTAGE